MAATAIITIKTISNKYFELESKLRARSPTQKLNRFWTRTQDQELKRYMCRESLLLLLLLVFFLSPRCSLTLSSMPAMKYIVLFAGHNGIGL